MAAGPKKKIVQLIGDMDSSYRVVRDQSTKALQQFTSAFQEIDALNAELQKGLAGAFHREDPYLLGLQIKRCLQALVGVERNVTANLRTLLQDVRKIYSRNTDFLKAVVNEYYKCQRLVPMQQLNDIEAVLAVVGNADASDYQNTILELYKSLSDSDLEHDEDPDAKLVDAIQETSKASEIGFKYDLSSLVQREGCMQRKTTILGRWKPQQFVLTKAGFLHYFSSDPLTPDATFPLSKCRLDLGDEPATFVITEVNILMDSKTTVKCITVDDMKTWLKELEIFCRK